jgi:mono/diheme cytochrome c family protein
LTRGFSSRGRGLYTTLAAVGWILAAPAGAADAAGKVSEATLELYRVKCQQCHMADGNSPLEDLSFVDAKWKHGSSRAEVKQVITEGVPATPMLPFKGQLTPKQIEELADYVRSFDKSLKPGK